MITSSMKFNELAHDLAQDLWMVVSTRALEHGTSHSHFKVVGT
jgi:hypothetical protein